jgi:hypothetical protein
MLSAAEPTNAEVQRFVADVVGRLMRGDRLPLSMRLALDITAEMEAAMRMPEEADICAPDPATVGDAPKHPPR